MSAAVPVSEMSMVITMQESSPAPRGSLPELCTFGAIALADIIRRRKVSAEEVMATYLDQPRRQRGHLDSASGPASGGGAGGR